jgi:hypothetical protein
MTGQISDTVIFQEDRYVLLGSTVEELASPSQFGLVPGEMHTACWRGYYLTYKIDGEKLWLDEMTIRTRDNKYPPINGIDAIEINYNKVYQNIDIPLIYTGKILIGKDFMNEKYIHMGFQPASSYQTVLELEFAAGLLKGVSKISTESS